MSGGKQPDLYKDDIFERKITNMAFDSLLYLHESQMKYVNV